MKNMKSSSKALVFLLLFLTVSLLLGKNVNFYYIQGIMAFNSGNYLKAEEYLKTALMLDPSLENNSNIKYMIGLSAWYSGDLVTARAYLPENNVSIVGSSNKVSKRNLVNEIAHWEKIGMPVVTDEKNFHKKKIPSWIGWLASMGIFSIIMGAFWSYKHSKKEKTHEFLSPEKEEEIPFSEKEEFPPTDIPLDEETPSDVPTDDEIRKKLQTLLQGNKDTQNKNTAVLKEPEKIIEGVGSDASEEELTNLTQAVQEILSQKPESSRT